MPVSVKIDPFSKKPIPRTLELRTPQARVLAAIMPEYEDQPHFDWPIFTRYHLCVRTGTSTSSMSPNRALNGIPAGSSSGEPHPGLLAREMVEIVMIDVEGRSETCYRITQKGIDALKLFFDAHGGKLPEKRKGVVNKRYRKDANG